MGILTSLLAQKIDRSPVSDYWYQPIGVMSKAGVAIGEDQALRISAVLQGTRFVCQTIAMLPRFIFRHLEDGRSREKDTDHPLNRSLRFQPNAWQTAFQWFELSTAHAMLKGLAISEKVIDDRGQLALIPLEPSRIVEIAQRQNGMLRYVYRQQDGRSRTILQEEIFALPGFGLDGVRGLPLINQMRETAGLAVAMEAYGANFFSNSAIPPLVLQSDKTVTSAARQRIKDDWQRAHGGNFQHSTALLEEGTKAELLSFDNEKSQFVEARRFIISEFSRFLDVTPHRLSDMEKSSYNNVEQMSLETVVYTIAPWVKRWEQSIYRDLLGEEDKEAGYFFEFILEGLLRGDTEARGEFYSKMVNFGIMTRNEVRERENLNPKEGLDEPLQPSNTAPVGQGPAQVAPQPAQPSPPQNGNGNANQDRATALALAAAERVLRREQMTIAKWSERKTGEEWKEQVKTFYREHIDYVAKALALDENRARAWCSSRCQHVLKMGPSQKPFSLLDRVAVQSLAMEALGP